MIRYMSETGWTDTPDNRTCVHHGRPFSCDCDTIAAEMDGNDSDGGYFKYLPSPIPEESADAWHAWRCLEEVSAWEESTREP